MTVNPGSTDPNRSESAVAAAGGTIEVDISLDITNTANDRYAIHNAVTQAVQAKLGFDLPGPYSHVLYSIEKCYVGCGYAAYAYVNSWMSVYVDIYYGRPGVLMHEVSNIISSSFIPLLFIDACEHYM